MLPTAQAVGSRHETVTSPEEAKESSCKQEQRPVDIFESSKLRAKG